MNQEIEIEFKNLLTKEEYELLSSIYFSGHTEPYTQKNVYYDTDTNELKKANCALRIRIKDENAEFTLKSPFEGHHKELNIPLTIKEAEDLVSTRSVTLPAEIRAFLKTENQIEIDLVSKIAELTTERIEKEYKGCLIVLDKSRYSEIVDYELEIESPFVELGKEMFLSILSEHGIPKRETLNKIARAYNALA